MPGTWDIAVRSTHTQKPLPQHMNEIIITFFSLLEGRKCYEER